MSVNVGSSDVFRQTWCVVRTRDMFLGNRNA